MSPVEAASQDMMQSVDAANPSADPPKSPSKPPETSSVKAPKSLFGDKPQATVFPNKPTAPSAAPRATAQTITSLIGPGASALWKNLSLRTGPVFKPAHEQRIMLCGWQGSGKSTFALSAPHCLLCDFEYGSDELPQIHPTSARVTLAKWEEFEDVLKALEADAQSGKRQFKTIAIDTADGMAGNQHSVAAEYIIRDSKADVIGAFGSNGNGWSRLSEMFGRALLRIQAAGYGCIATCHLTRKLVQIGDGQPRSTVTRDLIRRCDAILRDRSSFIGVVQKLIDTEAVKTTAIIKGKKVEVTQGTRNVEKHQLVFRSMNEEHAGMVKARLDISGTIVFDQSNGFGLFEKSYNEAVARASTPAP